MSEPVGLPVDVEVPETAAAVVGSAFDKLVSSR